MPSGTTGRGGVRTRFARGRAIAIAAAVLLQVAVGPGEVSVISQAEAAERTSPTVRVDGLGELVGRRVESGDRAVAAYLGVPYARAPVGALRWRPPQPVEPWRGRRDAGSFGAAAVQPRAVIKPIPEADQGEACLTLNIWTPTFPDAAGRSPDLARARPVLVWIHGGGFTTGSGGQDSYRGQHLASRGAVVVTINYRLGPIGFLAHPALSAESPRGVSGNYGLLDIIEALRWVQRHIDHFGGDADRVTVFGESAGSVAVGCLLVSPLAEGLFHRAVMQSGVPVGVTDSLEQAEAAGTASARTVLGDAGADAGAAALRAVDARSWVDRTNPRVGLLGRGTKFGPIVDGWVLPEPPMQAFAAGRFHDVPVLVGTNADEGTLFLRQLPRRIRPRGYEWLVRRAFPDQAEAVLRAYPAADAGADLKATIARLLGDSAFVVPADVLADRLAAGGAEVWRYHFTRVHPMMDRLGLGATHGIEIPYVFGTPGPMMRFDDVDRRVSETMQADWLELAAGGELSWRRWRGPDAPWTRRYGDRIDVVADAPAPAEARELFERDAP